jgi:hypothetical protein
MSTCDASYAADRPAWGSRKLPVGHVGGRRDFGPAPSFSTVTDHDVAGEEVSVCQC